LSYETQAWYAQQDEREKEIHRAHHEAAHYRKKLQRSKENRMLKQKP
jgi:hypothetical protein